MAEVVNLLGKITDPMIIIIRVVGLMDGCFWFLWEFIGFLYFLLCPPMILGGFMWRQQMSLQLVIVRLMARCFWFLWEFIGFLFFLECPPKILGGFVWRLQRSLQLVIVRLSLLKDLFSCRLTEGVDSQPPGAKSWPLIHREKKSYSPNPSYYY